MAASGPGKELDKFLDLIDEDYFSCSICFEQYKDPKILPCLHTFCEACLLSLVDSTDSTQVSCPTCKEGAGATMTTRELRDLRGNELMMSLVKIFNERRKVTRDEGECEVCEADIASHICVDCPQYLCPMCTETHTRFKALRSHKVITIEAHNQSKPTDSPSLMTADFCEVHRESKLKFYCDTCKVPVCTDCTVVNHRFPEHVQRDIRDVARQQKELLKIEIETLNQKFKILEASSSAAKNKISALRKLCQKEKEKVKEKANEVKAKVDAEHDHVIAQLKTQYKEKEQSVQNELDEIEMHHGRLASLKSYLNTLIHHGNAAQLMSSKTDVMTRIDEVVAMDMEPNFSDEVVTFQPLPEFKAQGILGFLATKRDVCISQCTIENVPRQLLKGEFIDLVITTRDKEGTQVVPQEEVEAKLLKPDGSWAELEVVSGSDGAHKLSIRGETAGNHEVYMTINGQDMPGSPVEIVVTGLIKTHGRDGSGEGEFNFPHGITIDKDGRYVTADNSNSRVHIVTEDGRSCKSITFTEFKQNFRPFDIAISCGNEYFMTDAGNNQIVVAESSGDLLRCFGHKELKSPRGLAISPIDGAVHVANFSSNTVEIYTQDGEHVDSFGGSGSGDGQFMGPNDIDIDAQGVIFVSDYCNHRVQVFNSNHQVVRIIGCEDHNEGRLCYPLGIAVCNNTLVYISDEKHRILSYTYSGQFLCRVDCDVDGLSYPHSIALTNEDTPKLVVADTHNHCLKVFL
ncbi:E3 ubiquitin-protein ligase TRIM71-like [Saccoglossus kowalevskii]|uniref:Tripartite motif-containing protein 2-like n=1 Tax=Saccoglossus kowalevskii TaxID=10224 RepID=A0ABM0GPB8_SACKO|nr:PREDICTED: tripartite motif-containing protein 2-like [Saccoglossus kowalevskii]